MNLEQLANDTRSLFTAITKLRKSMPKTIKNRKNE